MRDELLAADVGGLSRMLREDGELGVGKILVAFEILALLVIIEVAKGLKTLDYVLGVLQRFEVDKTIKVDCPLEVEEQVSEDTRVDYTGGVLKALDIDQTPQLDYSLAVRETLDVDSSNHFDYMTVVLEVMRFSQPR